MANEQKNKSFLTIVRDRIIDSAVILAIFTALLFLFGWEIYNGYLTHVMFDPLRIQILAGFFIAFESAIVYYELKQTH